MGLEPAMPSHFNRLASAAARLGRAAIPALMLAARDGRTLRAQLCAINALGMMSHPTAVEARRRISLLEVDGDRGRIVRSAFPDSMPFGEPWDVDKVIAALLRHGYSSAQRAAFPAAGNAIYALVERTEAVERERNHLKADDNRLKAVKAASATARKKITEARKSKAEAAERARKERAEKPKTNAEVHRRVERAEAAERARVALETRRRLDARWTWLLEQAEAAEGRRLLREAMPRDEALKQDRKRVELDAVAPEVCEPPKWKSTWADLGPLGDDSWREQD